MNLLSIISEYNPFHNGHDYHLRTSIKTNKSSHTMAIMSGHFLQRGEPALIDKWTRAKIAVKNGIDLVVELPFVYSCQSAEIFAYGAILILNSLNVVNNLCFGCEDNSLDSLQKIAQILVKEPKEYKLLLKNYLNKGLSFPKARQLAVGEIYPDCRNLIDKPNNILAIEYLKWLYAFNSNITPVPIKRVKAGYHDLKPVENFVGATYIRNLMRENDLSIIKPYVPSSTFREINTYYDSFAHLDDYYSFILSNLLKSEATDLKKIFDVGEGLENRILKTAYVASNMDELIEKIKTKRYTSTRIKRILVHFLLGYTKNHVEKFFKNDAYKPYLRVLAFNDKGREILKYIKENSDIKIITNVKKDYKALDPLQKLSLDLDVRATNFYYLVANRSKLNKDFIYGPEIILGE